MNKPLPWNVKGVGFDAREAARIAAKRAGLPLGEWLNGVISARASELGVQIDDVEPDDRLEAIAARLSHDGPIGNERSAQRPASSALRDAEPSTQLLNMAGSLRRPMMPALNEARPSVLARFGAPVGAAQVGSVSTAASATAGDLAVETRPWSVARSDAAMDQPRTPAAESASRTRGAAPRTAAQVETADLDARLASILEKLDRSFATVEDLKPVAVRDTGGRRRDGREAIAATAPNESRRKTTVEAGTPATVAAGAPVPDASSGESFAELHAAFKDLARKLDAQGSMPEAEEARAAADGLATELAALGQRVDRLRGATSGQGGDAAAQDLQVLQNEVTQLTANLSQLAPKRSIASLETAVRELTGQVDLSRLDGVQASVLAPVERLSREMREALRAADASPAIEALRRDLSALSGKMESLQQRDADPKSLAALRRDMSDMRDGIALLADRLGTAEHLRGEVVALGDRVSALAETTSPAAVRDLGAAVGEIQSLLRGFAANGVFGALDQKIDGLAERLAPLEAPTSGLAALHERIGSLSGKIDAIGRSSQDVNALYGLVGNLADRLEDARKPQADAEAMSALQTQIGTLVERLDRTTATDTTLQGLERLIGDLFLQIEQSRNVAIDAAENAARAAAQDTLRAAMDNPALNGAELTVQTGLDVDHVSQELAELRRVQETADRRINTTLTALNTTLERLVDRLVTDGGRVESEAEPAASAAAKPGRRRGRVPPEPSVTGRDAEASVPPFDPEQFLLEPGTVGPRAAPADRAGPDAPRAGGNISSEVAPLIAAARRAAQAAQASALEASLKIDTASDAAPAPAGRTRSFFASKRRALLLGLAGLVLALGTLKIVQLSSDQSSSDGAVASEPTADDTAKADPKMSAPAAAAPEAAPQPEAAPAAPAPAAPPPAMPAPAAPAANGGASLLAPPPSADKVSAGFTSPAPVVAGGSAQAAVPASPSGNAAIGVGQGLRDLAASGNAAAQYEVGARLADGRGVTRDAGQAFTWFQRAAQQGSAPAQYRLGSLYEKGVGVPADAALAIAWYEKAAAQGNVRAMHNLAVMSAEGAVGKPDYGKAVTWFTKAASYGVRDSQFNLAVLFARGLGVPQNLGQSYAWFAVAAQQGDGDAVSKRDAVAAKLDGKALADAKSTVASFRALTPDTAANEVTPPPGGWDGAQARAAGRKSEARISSM